MSEAPKLKSLDGWLEIIVAVVGSFVGNGIINRQMYSTLPQEILTYNNTKLTIGGIMSIAAPVIVVVFGGKVHKLVTWFGVGWLIGSLTDWFTVLQTPYNPNQPA